MAARRPAGLSAVALPHVGVERAVLSATATREGPARLIMVSHAASDANRGGRFPLDEPVEAAALDKLHRKPPRLPGHDRCVVSPALRARQTAAALGLAPSVEAALRDQDFGRWGGLALDAVQAAETAAVGTWLDDPAAAPHGGESVMDLVARIGAWMDRVGDGADRLLAITHAAVLRAAVAHALGAGGWGFWRVDVGPLATARFSGRAGRWTLQALGPL